MLSHTLTAALLPRHLLLSLISMIFLTLDISLNHYHSWVSTAIEFLMFLSIFDLTHK